jgi:hypothetical protein
MFLTQYVHFTTYVYVFAYPCGLAVQGAYSLGPSTLKCDRKPFQALMHMRTSFMLSSPVEVGTMQCVELQFKKICQNV